MTNDAAAGSEEESQVQLDLKNTTKEQQAQPKKKNLAAMFEQNMQDEEERKVVLTKSEELLSSPDRRSLRQVKLADKFHNAVAAVVHTEEDEVKSDSASSDDEEGKEEGGKPQKEQKDLLDVQYDHGIFASNGSEVSINAVQEAQNFEFSIDEDNQEEEDFGDDEDLL